MLQTDHTPDLTLSRAAESEGGSLTARTQKAIMIPVDFKRITQPKASTAPNPLRGVFPSTHSGKTSMMSRFSFLYLFALGTLFYLIYTLNHLS